MDIEIVGKSIIIIITSVVTLLSALAITKGYTGHTNYIIIIISLLMLLFSSTFTSSCFGTFVGKVERVAKMGWKS